MGDGTSSRDAQARGVPGNNPVTELQQQRQDERQQAVAQLEALAQHPPTLQRPVFFVPGWTDEQNRCWTSPYRSGDVTINTLLARTMRNPTSARYVTFTQRQSQRSTSFLDFGRLLKRRIVKAIGDAPCDLVGHSMGGLDAIAAMLDDARPRLRVTNLVTVATPHQGSELGEIAAQLGHFSPHHALQAKHLDPDQPPIQFLNQLDTRRALLQRVGRLWCLMGTRDMAVMRSARYRTDGLSAALKQKIEVIDIGGARHSAIYGITQDPRLILGVITILLGMAVEPPRYHDGTLYHNA